MTALICPSGMGNVDKNIIFDTDLIKMIKKF